MGALSKHSESKGEDEIVRIVKCPNCRSRMMKLPPNFPLFDVQCTRCLFRAQIKTNHTSPKDQVFGSGRDMMEKNRRTGHLLPPLILNFKWKRKGRKAEHLIVLYPFLTRNNVRKRQRSEDGAHPGYREFNFVGLRLRETPKVYLLDKRLHPRIDMERDARGRKKSAKRRKLINRRSRNVER